MLLVYKPLGLTPFELIQKVKQLFPLYHDRKLSFAGRLDPMAEGLMLLLVDEENKERNVYEKMTKTYLFTLLLGVQTDTYDLLGIVNLNTLALDLPSLPTLQQITTAFTGAWEQEYPPYSSIHIKGKPIFYYARNNQLSEITIPKKEITVSSFSFLKKQQITKNTLQKKVHTVIPLVKGDFRQNEILSAWENFFLTDERKEFTLLSFEIRCSSGTYVRGIANSIGEKLGCGAIAFSIKRSGIGDYDITDKSVINLSSVF